jgi:hypothetical protein
MYAGESAEATPLSNGATVAALPLRLGANPCAVHVRSEDGTATQTYTFTVYRASGDATLKSLTLASTGGVAILLEPGFQPGLTSYRATVGSTIASLIATAATHITASNQGYAVSQTDAPAAAMYTPFGQSTLSLSNPLSLAVGENFLFIRVTSEDGVSISYYSIRVHRQSSVATLSTLTPTVGGAGGLTPLQVVSLMASHTR